MNNKQLTKVVKATIKANMVLPILESVLLTGNELHIDDLETRVIVPFQTGISACTPANRLLDALSVMDKPAFKDLGGFKVELSEGKRKIAITGDKPEDFPKQNQNVFIQSGTLNEKAMQAIESALKFASKDDLRPAMTGIYFGKDIAATDAHRLFFKPLESIECQAFTKPFIMPAKTAKILLTIGGTWTVSQTENYYVQMVNEAGVKVIFRAIDARYPDYPCVIPQGDGVATMNLEVKSFRKELMTAVKFANQGTKQVVFELNGKATIEAQDVDFGIEYKNELDVTYTGEILIGVSASMLDGCLVEVAAPSATMRFFGSNRAMLINDDMLLMPLTIAARV